MHDNFFTPFPIPILLRDTENKAYSLDTQEFKVGSFLLSRFPDISIIFE